MQRETLQKGLFQIILVFQSSPSMQRETTDFPPFTSCQAISILSLYAEGDLLSFRLQQTCWLFQSSPSMQRETRTDLYNTVRPFSISILSLYAEGDKVRNHISKCAGNFNPLPLCRGRPQRSSRKVCKIFISILSLYAEGDDIGCFFTQHSDISILSLYAEGDG